MMGWYGIVPGPARALAAGVHARSRSSRRSARRLWLSALNVAYRDVRYVVPFLVQFWMFATPVAYPSLARARQLARCCTGSIRWPA